MTILSPPHARHYVKCFTISCLIHINCTGLLRSHLHLKNWNSERVGNLPRLVKLGLETSLGNSEPELLIIMLCYSTNSVKRAYSGVFLAGPSCTWPATGWGCDFKVPNEWWQKGWDWLTFHVFPFAPRSQQFWEAVGSELQHPRFKFQLY